MTVEFANLPESFVNSDDDLVTIVRPDMTPEWEKIKRYGEVIQNANHREARIEELIETSDDENAEKYRLAFEKFEAEKAKAEKNLAALKAKAAESVSSGMDNSGLTVEQASALYSKARKAFVEYLDADAFPSIVQAMGDFKVPTVRELVGGKSNGAAGSHGEILRLRLEWIEFNGTRYDKVGDAAKVIGVDSQNLSKIIVETVGSRKVPNTEVTVPFVLNSNQYKVVVKGAPVKADAE